jgi:hypothetical protein
MPHLVIPRVAAACVQHLSSDYYYSGVSGGISVMYLCECNYSSANQRPIQAAQD